MNDKKPKFCVVGAGNGGLAMAGHLAIMGFDVKLYNRSEERLRAVKMEGGIDLTGEVTGFGKVQMATSNPEEAVADVDVIMIVVPATAHKNLAKIFAPYLKSGQIVILNPGRTFGALEFSQILKNEGASEDITVGETQTFLYASRVTGPGQAKIFRIKNSVPLATVRAFKIPQTLSVIRTAFPHFVSGDSIFKTSFDNIGCVFHPSLVVLNAGWIEDPSDFEFYFQGTTLSTSKILEQLDKERLSVASALGFRAMSAREWLYYAYDVSGKTLYEAIHSNPGYRGIMAPHNTNMRYITEDVPCSLVPMSSIGKKFNVQTPLIDSIIRIASAMHETDYYKLGRTVESLGIENMDLKQLRLIAIGEHPN
ncbi:MAG: NAD/NADP octopine/nopaline dehydrogenase family protein [Acidobacteriota bacterium]